jgi:proline iminopeptidase
MNESFFPEIAPFSKMRLKVDSLHEIYVEECGNPNGQAVLFLHGGPGAGLSEKHRRLFDPKHFRIVLFDQRGAGQSTPHAELKDNTTSALISDIEMIREKLKIQKWMVFGGSWGSTLALAYSETHPDKCTHLILRGIFLCRPEEINWFYQEGASFIFPDFWKDYLAQIPLEERNNMVSAYYKRLTSADSKIRLAAAKAWSGWEGSTLHLYPDIESKTDFEEDMKALSVARIECHYFMNGAFFRNPNQLIEDAHRIEHIPTVIIHGRYDVVCPVKNAFDLHAVLPKAELKIIPDAGHAVDEPGILKALIDATEKFKN